jgi:hypothetical protein
MRRLATIIRPRPPAEPGAPRAPLSRRLLWFAGLWLGGLGVTAAVAYTLRALPFLG